MLTDHIKRYFEAPGLDTVRLEAQVSAAKQITNSSKVVLQGPAGVGKTNVSLLWGLNLGAKKIVYVLPRVAIALGLYKDISEILPNVEVQLFTGEYKLKRFRELEEEVEDNYFLKSEIVLTTIDQFISLFTHHSKSNLVIDILNYHIVFDEFHELISLPSMAYYLKEFLELSRWSKCSGKILFMSATPRPDLTRYLLGEDKDWEDILVRMRSYHSKKFNFKILSSNDDNHLFLNKSEENSFFISNTVKVAQKGYLQNLKNENSLVYHSYYTKEDKSILINKIFENFGKNKAGSDVNILRAGPILQASLNVSAKNVYTDISSPEEILQRIGRCNRFSEYDEGNILIYYNRSDRANKKYLRANYFKDVSDKFLELLVDNFGESFSLTLNDLYDFYFGFCKDLDNYSDDFENFKEFLSEDLNQNNFYEPVDFFIKKAKVSDKMAIKTMRGSSRYVIPTVSDLNNNGMLVEKGLFSPGDKNNVTLTMDINDFKLVNILDRFQVKCKKLNSFYGEKIYNKHNSKRNFILRQARYKKYGIIIGDTYNNPLGLDYEDYNFTYVFRKNKKGEIYSLGLINKNDFEERFLV